MGTTSVAGAPAPGPELAELVHSVVSAHAGSPGPLLPILHDLNSSLGFIPAASIRLLADELNLSRADVYGVVTQYPDFADRPRGRRRIRFCGAEACGTRGAQQLAEQLVSSLGIAVGEVTTDGSDSLDEVSCLGLCAVGPAIEVDGVPYGRMNPAALQELLEVTA